MIALSDRARKKLGKRASAYVESHMRERWYAHGWSVYADHKGITDPIRATITRRYGTPAVNQVGSVFWIIDACDIVLEDSAS